MITFVNFQGREMVFHGSDVIEDMYVDEDDCVDIESESCYSGSSSDSNSDTDCM